TACNPHSHYIKKLLTAACQAPPHSRQGTAHHPETAATDSENRLSTAKPLNSFIPLLRRTIILKLRDFFEVFLEGDSIQDAPPVYDDVRSSL
ncbi:MAG: hypothetical protein WAV28_06135, partial [Sedimentisphaerales bacterium]